MTLGCNLRLRVCLEGARGVLVLVADANHAVGFWFCLVVPAGEFREGYACTALASLTSFQRLLAGGPLQFEAVARITPLADTSWALADWSYRRRPGLQGPLGTALGSDPWGVTLGCNPGVQASTACLPGGRMQLHQNSGFG